MKIGPAIPEGGNWAKLVLKAYANQARGLQAKTYYLTQTASITAGPWLAKPKRTAIARIARTFSLDTSLISLSFSY